MKNERSIPFSQSWCSLVATDVCRNPAPKKRFLDEYESSLCYRKSAKEIIQKGLFLDIVNVQAQKRVEAVKVAAVVYFLMFGNQTPAYTKLLSLFGREYARMTDAVSAIYKDTLGRNRLSKYFSKNSDQDSQGEMAIFVIYLLASPESKLIQNQAKYGLLFTTFEKDANAETAATEQDTILQKYGVPLQRNLFDYTREALIATKKTDISVKGINGDVNARNWFDYESYGFSCRYDTLLSMALHDAGVSEQPALERTITKQKFTDAQKAAAKSVYFTKLDEEHHNIDGGDFFAMIDDETIEMNEDGTIVAEEGAAVPTLALINLYNMLLPMYLAVRNLGEAYSEEVKATLSNELFGNGDRNSKDLSVWKEKHKEKTETISDEMLTFMSTDDIMDAAMQQELPTRYAIELCSWDEILGWKLAPSSIYIYGLEFCLSRVLWEMTFFGIEPHGVEQAKADLDASIEESKKNLDENGKPHGIPFEDFVKELLGDDYTEDWYPEEEQERDRRNMAIASYKGNKEAEYLLLML